MANESFSVSQATVSRSGKNITASFSVSAYGGYRCRVKVNGSVWKTSSASGSISDTYSTTFEAPGAGSKTFVFVMEIQWQQGSSTWSQWSDASRTASYSAASFTLSFNADGGSVSPASKSCTYGQACGTLPTPVREDYIFTGWFTQGGAEITAETVYSWAANVTIYAHWAEDSFSGVFVAAARVKDIYAVSGGTPARIGKVYAVIGGDVHSI